MSTTTTTPMTISTTSVMITSTIIMIAVMDNPLGPPMNSLVAMPMRMPVSRIA
jgi:hypothetical protein